MNRWQKISKKRLIVRSVGECRESVWKVYANNIIAY